MLANLHPITSGDDRLWRASAAEGRVVTTRVLPGPPPAGVAVGPNRVWVAIREPASVVAFDKVSLEQISSTDLPREPADLALTEEGLIVAVR